MNWTEEGLTRGTQNPKRKTTSFLRGRCEKGQNKEGFPLGLLWSGVMESVGAHTPKW